MYVCMWKPLHLMTNNLDSTVIVKKSKSSKVCKNKCIKKRPFYLHFKDPGLGRSGRHVAVRISICVTPGPSAFLAVYNDTRIPNARVRSARACHEAHSTYSESVTLWQLENLCNYKLCTLLHARHYVKVFVLKGYSGRNRSIELINHVHISAHDRRQFSLSLRSRSHYQ